MSKNHFNSNLLVLLVTGLLFATSAFSTHAQSSDFYFTMPDMQATSGSIVTVPVSLNNADGIFSMQIDVIMPDGVEFVGADVTDRYTGEFFNFGVEDHYNDDGERYRRIIIANIVNQVSAIEGNEGVLLNVQLKMPDEAGDYPIQLKNLQFFNPPTYTIQYIPDASMTIQVRDYYFTMPDMETTSGSTVTVPVSLNNVDGIFSLQIDVIMPDGVEFVSADVTDRYVGEFFNFGVEDHYNNDGERYHRIIIANIVNQVSAIEGNEGVLLNVQLKMPDETGDYLIQLKNLQFFNPPTYAIQYIPDASATITVTAGGKLGDVNMDGNVNITDVTALIDYLLSNDASSISLVNANVNGDDTVNITDVTALIDMLLSGNY